MKFILPIALICALLSLAHPVFAADEEQAKPAPVIYLPLKPKFTVNLQGKRHYLRAEVQLKLDNDATKSTVQLHNAAIRHALVLVLSDKDVKQITSMSGRESLRAEALAAVQEALKTYAGKNKGIEDLFFTDFVAQ